MIPSLDCQWLMDRSALADLEQHEGGRKESSEAPALGRASGQWTRDPTGPFIRNLAFIDQGSRLS